MDLGWVIAGFTQSVALLLPVEMYRLVAPIFGGRVEMCRGVVSVVGRRGDRPTEMTPNPFHYRYFNATLLNMTSASMTCPVFVIQNLVF